MMTIAAVLLTCASLVAVDGDAIKCDGVNMRDMGDGKPFVSGHDTPETHKPKCQEELEFGRAATAAMSKMLAGASVCDSGKRDRYGRPHVSVRLPNGRSVGSMLISEGLAVEWQPGCLVQLVLACKTYESRVHHHTLGWHNLLTGEWQQQFQLIAVPTLP
jgi:endonuclease YncB( thermonuclease family)